jgi:CRISPR/Cas system CMR-associated protein Cmr5 small subunit
MMPSYTELKALLEIDQSFLDRELSHQAVLYNEVGQAHVDAVDRRDALKEELGVVEANVENDIRETAERQKEKLTEGQVKALVKIDKDRKQAFTNYAKAKKEADRLSVLKESFHQRGGMIENLCKLYIANYYEQDSVRGTSRSDTTVYLQQRQRIAAHRKQNRA